MFPTQSASCRCGCDYRASLIRSWDSVKCLAIKSRKDTPLCLNVHFRVTINRYGFSNRLMRLFRAKVPISNVFLKKKYNRKV